MVRISVPLFADYLFWADGYTLKLVVSQRASVESGSNWLLSQDGFDSNKEHRVLAYPTHTPLNLLIGHRYNLYPNFPFAISKVW